MSTLPLHVERSAGGDATGVPIVMLHGWAMNLRVFDRLRADLAAPDGGRVPLQSWAIDLPGYGRSPWSEGAGGFEAQCAAVLNVLPARCVLAGWSMGAKIAMALAAQQPSRITALVLMSASPRFSRSEDWPAGADPATLQVFEDMVQRDWQQLIEDFLWLQVRGTQQAEETLGELQAALAAQGEPRREALLTGLRLLGAVDLRPMLAHVHQPALIIAGLNDRVTLPAAARWLAQALPGAKLVEIARSGHAPFISHHAQVAAAIRDFVESLPPGAMR